jgi:hypothetical protein
MIEANVINNLTGLVNTDSSALVPELKRILSSTPNNFSKSNADPAIEGNLIPKNNVANPGIPDAQTCINLYDNAHQSEYVSYFISMNCINQLAALAANGATEIQILIGQSPTGATNPDGSALNTLFFVGAKMGAPGTPASHVYLQDTSGKIQGDCVLEYILPDIISPTDFHASTTLE